MAFCYCSSSWLRHSYIYHFQYSSSLSTAIISLQPEELPWTSFLVWVCRNKFSRLLFFWKCLYFTFICFWDIFVRYRIPCWHIFYLSMTLQRFIHCLLTFIFLMSQPSFSPFYPYMTCLYPLAVFNAFLFIFNMLF